ncbi:unnamed protein product [Sphenostylis stenocarpa]|uniref:Zinc finger LSD1-type domain-containing protein n=1 Tax=Sphenostylis stenocarpa TaxID=92480 RepID=A0AA86S8K3_9FABA|nr:unnamed protein product [Sphenostylis stenocarpa]
MTRKYWRVEGHSSNVLILGDEYMQSQLVCNGCRSLLLYPRGATNVCCALCNTITSVPPPGMEMSQLYCGGCRTLLMYTRGATSVRCSCCHTVNLVPASNQVAHVHCGNCRTTLMYPYGAPSVKCALCHYITNVSMNSGRLPIPVHRPNGTTNVGTLPSTSTSMPQSQSQTVVVENPMSVDSSGKLQVSLKEVDMSQPAMVQLKSIFFQSKSWMEFQALLDEITDMIDFYWSFEKSNWIKLAALAIEIYKFSHLTFIVPHTQHYCVSDFHKSAMLRESWEGPSSAKKCLIPDSTVISQGCRARLRSANKIIGTRNAILQLYQNSDSDSDSDSDCSLVELESLPRHAQETKHEETEKGGDSADEAEMEEVSEYENQMASHSTQVEEHNALEVYCAPLEQEPLAEGIQASFNSREREDKKNSKTISMVGHSSSQFSLNLTHMVNMWDNEGDDEVNSVGQCSPKDTVEGYQVKGEFIPLLRKILTKHGDVFENSLITTVKFRSALLETICEMISELEGKDLNKTTDDRLHNMIDLAKEMKNMKVNIEWLHLRLEEIYKARQILKQCGMLKERKDSNKKVIESVKIELEQCEAEKKALTAQLKSVCDKESACKETLARADDESSRIREHITYAKSKVRPFFNCSLVDGLL